MLSALARRKKSSCSGRFIRQHPYHYPEKFCFPAQTFQRRGEGFPESSVPSVCSCSSVSSVSSVVARFGCGCAALGNPWLPVLVAALPRWVHPCPSVVKTLSRLH